MYTIQHLVTKRNQNKLKYVFKKEDLTAQYYHRLEKAPKRVVNSKMYPDGDM